MPLSTTSFVTLCKALRVMLKANELRKKATNGMQVVKNVSKLKPVLVHKANEDLVKERNRLIGVIKKTQRLQKSKGISLPKVFISAYEKHLRLVVKKFGPDLGHKDVRKAYVALETYLQNEIKVYSKLSGALARSAQDQAKFNKNLKTLAGVYRDFAKAFGAGAASMGVLPGGGGPFAQLFANMEECNRISQQLSGLYALHVDAYRTLELTTADAKDRLYFINEHLVLMRKKDFLINL